jgi:hypothetical protein
MEFEEQDRSNAKELDKGKATIPELYLAFSRLECKGWSETKTGWSINKICDSDSRIENTNFSLPIISINNNIQGPALWIIAGIHGEEPAGPNMIARNIEYIATQLSNIPTVIIPLCNPHGYLLNQRYLQEALPGEEEISVGDAQHMLLNDNRNNHRNEATNNESVYLTTHLLKESRIRPPTIVLDMHEDTLLDKGYIYTQGIREDNDKTEKKILEAMEKHVPIQRQGYTRFNEQIINGIVGPVRDRSIDEFIAASHIFIDDKVVKGIHAKRVYTIETPAKNIYLEKRILAQQSVLHVAVEIMKNKYYNHK